MGTVSVRRCAGCKKLTGEWGACIHCGAVPLRHAFPQSCPICTHPLPPSWEGGCLRRECIEYQAECEADAASY